MSKWKFNDLYRGLRKKTNPTAERAKALAERSAAAYDNTTAAAKDSAAAKGSAVAKGSDTVDMSTVVGGVELGSPVMCAAGASGYGSELDAYFPLKDIGAIVVKSLLHKPWEGNPAPRVASVDTGMINSVGLSGPGIEAWIQTYLDDLIAAEAKTVVSIWGRSVADYELAAQMLKPVAKKICAIEVNISCPNVEDRNNMFAHSAVATKEVLDATKAIGPTPRWAKLSPNIADLVPIAQAAKEGGASAVTVANTMIGLAVDVETRKPKLGNGRGGLSGPGIRPIAVRATHDITSAIEDLDVIGCGGIRSGPDALEYLIAGAKAVQVGTAIFADPRAPINVANEIEKWCKAQGITDLDEVIGTIQF